GTPGRARPDYPVRRLHDPIAGVTQPPVRRDDLTRDTFAARSVVAPVPSRGGPGHDRRSPMRSVLPLTFALGLGLFLSPGRAGAQMMYPMGYGGFGMSRWGADPAAGYMAGLGAYARGQGVYALEKAKADAINRETMLKWNKALRARQLALREEQRKEAAARLAATEAAVAQRQLADGTTLNDILLQ